MSTHPYIPLYVDDFDAATAHLTLEEDGAYNRLLRLCWRTPGCSLPNDMAWIARKIRVTPEVFERVAQPVLDEFFVLVRGRLVQRRLRDEYDNISRKKSARVAAGKKGGTAKAQKTHDNPASNASVLPSDTRAFPEPYPEPYKNPPKPPRDRAAETDGFEEFWSAYPRKTSKGTARKAYVSALRKAPADRILAGVRRYRFSDEQKFIPHPTTWLNGERWADGEGALPPDPPPEADPELSQWRLPCLMLTKNNYWNTLDWGPRPGTPGCRCPARILRMFDINPEPPQPVAGAA